MTEFKFVSVTVPGSKPFGDLNSLSCLQRQTCSMGTKPDLMPKPIGTVRKSLRFQVSLFGIARCQKPHSHADVSVRWAEPTTRLPCRRSWLRVPSSALREGPEWGLFV